MENTPRKLTPWNPIDQFRLLWWLFIAPDRYMAYLSGAGEESTRKTAAWLASTLLWVLPLILILAVELHGFDTLYRSEFAYTLAWRDHWYKYGPAFLFIIPVGWLLTSWLGCRKGLLVLATGGIFTGVLALAAGYFSISIAKLLESTYVSGLVNASLGTIFLALGAGGVAGAIAFVTSCRTAAIISLGLALGIALGSVASATVFTGTSDFHLTLLIGAGILLAGFMAVLTITAYLLRRNQKIQRASFFSKAIPFTMFLAWAIVIGIYLLNGWKVLVGSNSAFFNYVF